MDEQGTHPIVEWNLSDAFGGRISPEELDGKLNAVNWEDYRGKVVKLRGCLPVWGFLMVGSRLVGIAHRVEWVSYDGSAVPVWTEGAART
jgi:hypothetical protein